jgi:hypothetical protein
MDTPKHSYPFKCSPVDDFIGKLDGREW